MRSIDLRTATLNTRGHVWEYRNPRRAVAAATAGHNSSPAKRNVGFATRNRRRDPAGTVCIGISRPAEPTGHFQYGISSLLLVITLFAILCSITKMNPGLGIMAAILAVPALLWTTFAAVRRRDHGDPMSSGEKAGVFLLTVFAVFGVIIAVIGAFAVAFFAMCAVTSGPGQDEFGSLILSVICGGVAALAAAVFCVVDPLEGFAS